MQIIEDFPFQPLKKNKDSLTVNNFKSILRSSLWIAFHLDFWKILSNYLILLDEYDDRESCDLQSKLKTKQQQNKQPINYSLLNLSNLDRADTNYIFIIFFFVVNTMKFRFVLPLNFCSIWFGCDQHKILIEELNLKNKGKRLYLIETLHSINFKINKDLCNVLGGIEIQKW